MTTTPRPVRVVLELLADPATVVTRGRTLDNAPNLDPATLRFYLNRYGGTRLGRQEIDGELLDDVPGALWTRDRIDELRMTAAPELGRIVVGIDPAVSSSEDADETGIVVAARGVDGQGYLLADLSGRYSPDGWARRAVEALRSWGADRIVAEVNQGGDLVESMIRTIDPGSPYRGVHASRGKRTRAEPVSALYEQGRIHHVGAFPALEDQLCAALPDGGSGPDDRLDALVWAFTELGLTGSSLDVPGIIPWANCVWWCRCGYGFTWAPAAALPALLDAGSRNIRRASAAADRVTMAGCADVLISFTACRTASLPTPAASFEEDASPTTVGDDEGDPPVPNIEPRAARRVSDQLARRSCSVNRIRASAGGSRTGRPRSDHATRWSGPGRPQRTLARRSRCGRYSAERTTARR